jgi:hypothetical protein
MRGRGRELQKAAGLFMPAEQGLHLPAQSRIARAGVAQVRLPVEGAFFLKGGQENVFDLLKRCIHGSNPSSKYTSAFGQVFVSARARDFKD